MLSSSRKTDLKRLVERGARSDPHEIYVGRFLTLPDQNNLETNDCYELGLVEEFLAAMGYGTERRPSEDSIAGLAQPCECEELWVVFDSCRV